MNAPQPDEAYAIDHYRADAAALDVDAFMLKHGGAFLLMGNDSEAGLQFANGPRKTMASSMRPEDGAWRPDQYRVWPVRKTGRSLIARNISVGRIKTNDVVIPDVSLSKFHAFFRKDGDSITLQDAGSRNGTFVDGVRVNRTGDGPAMVMITGMSVRFGSVELTFVDAAALRRTVLEVCGSE